MWILRRKEKKHAKGNRNLAFGNSQIALSWRDTQEVNVLVNLISYLEAKDELQDPPPVC